MHILKEMEINCKKPQGAQPNKNIIFFSLSLNVLMWVLGMFYYLCEKVTLDNVG